MAAHYVVVHKENVIFFLKKLCGLNFIANFALELENRSFVILIGGHSKDTCNAG